MEKIICLSTSKIVKGYDDSKIAMLEKNDCVVRAFAACFNISYDKAHEYVKKNFNRKDRTCTINTIYTMFGLTRKRTVLTKKIKMIGDKKEHSEFCVPYKYYGKTKRKMTLLTFLREYNVGTYFILVHKHALAIKDGVLIGNNDENYHLRRIINGAFKIE